MSFADEVAAVSAERIRCKTCQILNEQPDADDIRAYMAANPSAAAAVAKALEARGFPVGASSVRDHFKSGHDLRG